MFDVINMLGFKVQWRKVNILNYNYMYNSICSQSVQTNRLLKREPEASVSINHIA